ncbi:MAG: hypothetical protein WCG19_05370 [Chlorobiaceae bacterium]
MNDFIAKLAEQIALGIVRALARPGIMAGLASAWHAAMEPQQVTAAKPDRDDDAFINDAKKDGWGGAVHHADRQP